MNPVGATSLCGETANTVVSKTTALQRRGSNPLEGTIVCSLMAKHSALTRGDVGPNLTRRTSEFSPTAEAIVLETIQFGFESLNSYQVVIV